MQYKVAKFTEEQLELFKQTENLQQRAMRELAEGLQKKMDTEIQSAIEDYTGEKYSREELENVIKTRCHKYYEASTDTTYITVDGNPVLSYQDRVEIGDIESDDLKSIITASHIRVRRYNK